MSVGQTGAFNTVQAAAYIGTTPSMLRLSRHTGELYKGVRGPEFCKCGARKVIYLKRDLDAWLDRQRTYRSNAEVGAESAKAEEG